MVELSAGNGEATDNTPDPALWNIAWRRPAGETTESQAAQRSTPTTATRKEPEPSECALAR